MGPWVVCPWLQPFEAFRLHRRTGLTRTVALILVKNFEHLRAALSLSLSRQVKVSLSDQYACLTEITLVQIGKNLGQPSTGNRGSARVATIPKRGLHLSTICSGRTAVIAP